MIHALVECYFWVNVMVMKHVILDCVCVV